MSQLERLSLTLCIIFISLLCGWACRQLGEKYPCHLVNLNSLRHGLQIGAIFVLLPLSAALSLWGLPAPDASLLLLPFIGLASYIWGGGLAVLAARLAGFSRIRTGSFFCCGAFTNIGAVGGLVCLLFLGENSIALVALYRLLEELYYFSIAFPIARWFGVSDEPLSFRSFRLNPTLIVIISALLLGIALNLFHVPRPPIGGVLASICMVTATICFLFSIGLTLRISRLGNDFKPAMLMSAIKFVGIPLLIVPLAILSGFASLEDGLPLKCVTILCSMPVAMTALIPPSLFNLDVDLANACWIFSTLGLLIWLPALMLILPII